MMIFDPLSDTRAKPWQQALFILGLFLVFAVWFGTRVYTYNYFQRPDNPVTHPMTKIYHDMAVSLDEGRELGEVNVTRIIRNKNDKPTKPYNTQVQPNDSYQQFKPLDPGYGVIYAAARHIFYFIPDTIQRPIMLQLFCDAVILFLLFFTFYAWGWLPAVAAGLLYSTNIVFANAAATPWYHFWDGAICTITLIHLLWLYRAAKIGHRPQLFLILLALVVGTVLGMGVWIRSSWFVFAPVIFGVCLFSKTLRPWLIYMVVAYGLLAGTMVMRATDLRNGELSYSTRMSWHTAFQGLGRHPNPYGIEDNDLYLFERTKNNFGVDYNLTDYTTQDQAIKKDYLALWQKDPGFIVRSISQRIFSNIFFNFDDGRQVFWNHGMLFLAVGGLILGLWLGSQWAFFASLSALLFAVINAGYGFVYYITREYAYATQMLLLFGVVVAVAGWIELGKRIWHRDWINFNDGRVHPAGLMFISFAFMMVILFIPPIQKYLSTNQKIAVHWDSPNGISAMAYQGLQSQVENLTPDKRKQFMQFAEQETTEKASGPDDIVFQYAMQHLRHVIYTNRDEKSGFFWINKKTDDDVYQVLTRASESIAGLGYDYIEVFNVEDSASWSVQKIIFKILPNDILPSEKIDELLQQKFSHWGWQLTRLDDNSYLAVHNGQGCSETRQELAQYFVNQCRALDHVD
jgi:hypothetical protein